MPLRITDYRTGWSIQHLCFREVCLLVGSFLDDGVEILDISDPANPTHVGAITDNGTTELDGVRGIYVSGKYAYVVS
ncbi:MAG: hypothetical protein R3B93_13070 [Bacteroidia bacterium]